MNNYDNLSNKKEELQRLHHIENLSIAEIASQFNTYPNKIRRDMKKLGVELKDRSETLKAQYLTNKRIPPNKDKPMSEEDRVKLGNKLSEVWSNYTEEERKNRSEVCSESLAKIDRDSNKKSALQGILKAAKEGSKLEKYVRDLLIEQGYLVEYHKEHLIINERLHLDIFLPKLNVVIEIDGPTHHSDVFGGEVLSKTQVRDLQKNGLIVARGLVMLRVIQDRKLSQTNQRKLGQLVLDTLEELKKEWPSKDERIKTIKLGV